MSYHDSLECSAAQEKSWGGDAPAFDAMEYLERLRDTEEFDLVWDRLLEEGELKELARRTLKLGWMGACDGLNVAHCLSRLVGDAAQVLIYIAEAKS